MRFLAVVVLLAGCSGGSDDIDAPDCVAGEFRSTYTVDGVVHEHEAAGGLTAAFVNKISDDNGYLDVSDGAVHVRVEFDHLVANGDTTDARGYYIDPNDGDAGLDVGNCETGGFPSRISPRTSGTYVFELSDLNAAPYCSGTAFASTITGCYKSSN